MSIVNRKDVSGHSSGTVQVVHPGSASLTIPGRALIMTGFEEENFKHLPLKLFLDPTDPSLLFN